MIHLLGYLLVFIPFGLIGMFGVKVIGLKATVGSFILTGLIVLLVVVGVHLSNL